MRSVALVLLALVLSATAAFAARPRLLLGWYLREVRRMPVAEDPGEVVASYPLA